MNGYQHAITTAFITTLILLLYDGALSIPVAMLFMLGALVGSHKSYLNLSPDIDLSIGRVIGKNIHRKWYFHSYILMIPVVWVANDMHSQGNVLVASLLFGYNFGWNLHIIEDWLMNIIRHRRFGFSPIVILTSVLGAVLSFSALSLFVPDRFLITKIIYSMIYNSAYLSFVKPEVAEMLSRFKELF